MKVSESVLPKTRRELFAACGQLLGHYPVADWLRPACSYAKRIVEGEKWEDYIGNHCESFMHDILARVEKEDPVLGVWQARSTSGRV